MNQSFKDGVQFAFDSVSLTLAQECPKKYQYYMIDGWQPHNRSVHLLFGGWYATALEHFHKHRAQGDEKDVALRKVVREALEATWIREQCLDCEGVGVTDNQPQGCTACFGEGYTNYAWSSDHPGKTRENLIRTIIWYVDHFDPDPLETVTLSDGRPAVEYSFTLELAPDILYCGHIDRLVSYGGDIYVQDQKTTGSTISSYYFDKFNPDIQMSGYTFAGRAIYNMPVKGVIIDAVQIAVGFSRFERGFTFRTDAQLDEWREDSIHYIKTIQQHSRDGFFPRNRTSCDKFGGCEFRTVCSRSPEVRNAFLEGEFQKREVRWDPLERR